jgi:hypothetical protein
MKPNHSRKSISALLVKQWLSTWDKIEFHPKLMQTKPEPHFYLFSMKASELKLLTGVYRRSIKNLRPRSMDPNVQREHNEDRSRVISDFVQHGYPWCEMSRGKRESQDFNDLRKPGWLPTAIVVNILQKGEKRNEKAISSRDQVLVNPGLGTVELLLPEDFKEPGWHPESIYPLEVIDGQHRLWAFDELDIKGDFELPVVAFHGLDRSWQAYLFWSINITPKRIKQSLAFDLYPLLRTEDWLERFQGHSIYRETRAQELTEALWANPKSPWHQKINMLGDTGSAIPMASQAAWVRSLMATLVRSWDSKTGLGGLFGAPLRQHSLVLPWSRAMQAAFLIHWGNSIRDSIFEFKAGWAKHLRQEKGWNSIANGDAAFYGPNTLLSTDQGVRGILFAVNDVVFCAEKFLNLASWNAEAVSAATDEEAVDAGLKSLKSHAIGQFLKEIADGLADYDWRTSAAPGLTETERRNQSLFKGSGGYRELRRQLLHHLQRGAGPVGKFSKLALGKLGQDA